MHLRLVVRVAGLCLALSRVVSLTKVLLRNVYHLLAGNTQGPTLVARLFKNMRWQNSNKPSIRTDFKGRCIKHRLRNSIEVKDGSRHIGQ